MGEKGKRLKTRSISMGNALSWSIGVSAVLLLLIAGMIVLLVARGGDTSPALFVLGIAGILLLALIVGGAAVRKRLRAAVNTLTQNVYGINPERLTTLPATRIQELDQLTATVTEVSQDILRYASRMGDIVDAVGIPMGAFEVQEDAGRVFFTESMFHLLGMPHSDGAHHTHFLDLHAFAEIFPGLMLPDRHDVAVEERMTFERMGSDPQEIWLHIRLLRHGSTVYGTVVDISEEEQRKKWLEFERDYDPLTRLLNRHSYPAQMNALIKADPSQMGVLLFGDLDNLKFINDTYGHDMGDRYIQMAAGALQRFEAMGGVVARISGDEFAVYLHGESTREALRTCVDNMLRDIRRESMELPDGSMQKVRISVGLAYYPDDAENIDMLVRYADFAMYEIKHSFKGGTKEFDVESFEKNSFILHKLNQLDRLIEYRRLTFAYQPIIDVRTGEVFGYEALLRPLMREIHTPREVLTLAKNQSKLYQIEKLTLSYTLNWYQEHQEQLNGKKLFINLIANQKLSDEDMREINMLMQNSCDHLVMEVSEADHSEEECIEEKITMLREKGYHLALDDYGTGYSSEQSLAKLAPEYVKLDMTLVRNIDTDENRQKILKQIISHARNRQVAAIAEGVETKAELEMVIALGAQYVQGFYTGRPEYELNRHIQSACMEASEFHQKYHC